MSDGGNGRSTPKRQARLRSAARSALTCLVAGSVVVVACHAPNAAQPPNYGASNPDSSSSNRPDAPGSTGPAEASAPLHVRLLAFNDFHGHLRPPTGKVHGVTGPVGGAAYFAAHLKRLAKGQTHSMVVAAGDLVGGSPLTSALFHDEPTVEAMNEMGLQLLGLGNHELDEGFGELLRLQRGGCHPVDGCVSSTSFPGARFQILGANVIDKARGAPALPATAIRTFEGVPVGFIGMTLEDTPGVVVPSGIEGLKFTDEVKTAAPLVSELRRQGVEAIVLLLHQGGTVRGGGLDDCNDLRGPIVKIAERLDPAVDVIVSGHTHALYNCRIDNRPVTSALSFGRVITSIDLTIDRRTRDIVRADAKNHAVTHDVAPDPAVTAIVERASTLAGPRENRVVGKIAKTIRASSGPSGESPLGSLIADAQLEATKKSGAMVALMNPGGLRADLVFERSGEEPTDGLVTYGEAFAAQPFGNVLVTVTMSGAELASLLEREARGGSVMQVSDGLRYRWSVNGPKRVTSIKVNGQDLAEGARVRVTVNSFLAETETVLKRAADRVTGPVDLDALEAYFRARPIVDVNKSPRIERE